MHCVSTQPKAHRVLVKNRAVKVAPVQPEEIQEWCIVILQQGVSVSCQCG